MTVDLPGNPDVVVIGAGAAGLAAARALIEGGRSVVVLEAGPVVGGRCIAESTTFGVPFDRGGAWMHAAAINPLVPLAERAGYTIHKADWRYGRVRIGGQELGAGDLRRYDRYHETMWSAIVGTGRKGCDVVAAEVLPASPWQTTARHWIAQHLSVDAEQVSTADMAAYANAEGDWLLAEGLGTLIAHLGAQVPVRLNCPVTAVDWSGPRIAVSTPEGRIEAAQVIVTVSTGVLAAETITFTPRLPDRKLQAIDGLPTGLLNKIGILFAPGRPAEVTQGYLADYHPGGEAFCSLHFGFFGTGLAVAFVAGRFAQDLEAQGPGAGTAFCLEGLRALFGNDIARQIKKTDETAWMGHPLTLGSYSAARPGQAGARAVLAEPLDERLFFAGEATIPTAFATVHGAHLSGLEVAGRILAMPA